LHRVSEGGLAQLLEKIEGVFSKGLSFEDTIREIVFTQLRFFDERRALYRVHFELRFPHGRDPFCDPKKHNPPPEKQLYVDRLTRYLKEQFDDRQDAPRLAQFISETVAGLLFRRIPETGGPRLEDDAEFLSDLLLNGLSGRRKKS